MLFSSRRPQKDDPVDLYKTGHCQPAYHGQRRSSQGSGSGSRPAALDTAEETEVDQQFTDKTIQRRQAADCNRPHPEQQGRVGETAGDPPHQVYFTGAGGMND